MTRSTKRLPSTNRLPNRRKSAWSGQARQATLVGTTLLVLAATAACAAGPSEGVAGSSVTLGAVEHLPPALDNSGAPWRGPMSWRAPAHWTAIDASSRPFVAAEYALPGDREEQPARCLIRNGSAAGGEDSTEVRRDAERLVRRSDLKTATGESLRKQVEIEEAELGSLRWLIGTVDGTYVDDGTVLDPRDPALVVAEYSSWSAAPLSPGPPFSIRCSAPTDVLRGERPGLRQWLASFTVEAPE